MQYPVSGPCALKRTASFAHVLFIERHFKRTLSGTGVVVTSESEVRKWSNFRTVTPLKDTRIQGYSNKKEITSFDPCVRKVHVGSQTLVRIFELFDSPASSPMVPERRLPKSGSCGEDSSLSVTASMNER